MANADHSSPIREVVLRAWTDPEFKQKLMEDPKAVFSEFGIEVPEDGRDLTVVENGSKKAYFVLPETPDLGSLSDDQIQSLVDSALGVQLVLPTIAAR